ncbi:MAG: QueT transporter family protein [Clostridia bacterium]|nr:QueT transporter family protein [Clostridia bacterium]
MNKTRYITHAAIIAAVYAAITLLLAPMSFAAVQLRVSEAMTILPILTPAAIPGLAVGCLVANLFGSASALDIVFGTLATLIAAIITRRLRKKPVLAAAAPVVANALIIGLVLSLTIENMPFWFSALTVGAGEVGACYVLGLPLLWAIRRYAPGLEDREV